MQPNTLRSILRFLFNVLTRLEVTGLEKVPPKGGYILATNHVSRLDPALVFMLVDRPDVTALVADKYKSYPFFRWIVSNVRGIWLNREQADIQALRAAREFLEKGGALGIAPEGTRSNTGALIPAKTGVAYLADKAQVPIIPVALSGTDKVFHAWLRLRRPLIRVEFGDLFTLSPLDRRDRSGSLQRYTDEIMCRIAAMLPLSYRGVYAGHPLLKEMLARQNKAWALFADHAEERRIST